MVVSNNNLPYANLNLQNYPYLLFNISEYSGDVYSTNSTNCNSVTRLVIAKHFFQGRNDATRPNMSGFLLLRPLLPKGTSCLEFKPTPITSLDTLTFSINTPDGLLYANENPWNLDNLRLHKIAIDMSSGFPKIELHLGKIFIPTIYEIGDNIIIKSFEFLKLAEGITYIDNNLNEFQRRIKAYLTSLSGIHITNRRYCDYSQIPITIANTDRFGFCNILTVPLPLDMIQDFHNDIPEKVWDVGGCLLNKSIQPVITIKVTCKETQLNSGNLLISH